MPPPYLFHAAASGGKYAWKPVNFQAGYLRAFGFPYASPVFLQKKQKVIVKPVCYILTRNNMDLFF